MDTRPIHPYPPYSDSARERDPPTVDDWLKMSIVENKKIDGAFSLMDEDATLWTNANRSALPRQSAAILVREIMNYVPMTMTLNRTIRTGSTVVLECSSTGITEDGTSYDNVYVFIVEASSSGIRSIREYADTRQGRNVIPTRIIERATTRLAGNA